MIVRALDANGDWTFGAGRSNYKGGLLGLQQNLQTRCLEILGDCFFNTAAGLDWLNMFGGVQPQAAIAMDFGLRAVIVNTQNVLGITSQSNSIDDNGFANPIYNVQDAFSTGTAAANPPTVVSTGDLLDELGDILTTEDGTAIGV